MKKAKVIAAAFLFIALVLSGCGDLFRNQGSGGAKEFLVTTQAARNLVDDTIRHVYIKAFQADTTGAYQVLGNTSESEGVVTTQGGMMTEMNKVEGGYQTWFKLGAEDGNVRFVAWADTYNDPAAEYLNRNLRAFAGGLPYTPCPLDLEVIDPADEEAIQGYKDATLPWLDKLLAWNAQKLLVGGIYGAMEAFSVDGSGNPAMLGSEYVLDIWIAWLQALYTDPFASDTKADAALQQIVEGNQSVFQNFATADPNGYRYQWAIQRDMELNFIDGSKGAGGPAPEAVQKGWWPDAEGQRSGWQTIYKNQTDRFYNDLSSLALVFMEQGWQAGDTGPAGGAITGNWLESDITSPIPMFSYASSTTSTTYGTYSFVEKYEIAPHDMAARPWGSGYDPDPLDGDGPINAYDDWHVPHKWDLTRAMEYTLSGIALFQWNEFGPAASQVAPAAVPEEPVYYWSRDGTITDPIAAWVMYRLPRGTNIDGSSEVESGYQNLPDWTVPHLVRPIRVFGGNKDIDYPAELEH